MSKEKQQIEEMAITICRKRHACILKDDESCRKCDQHERCLYQDIAYALYQEGYRRQSEVIEEYRKKVYSKMEKYTVFGREYIQRIMREVEKEMKGGAEE